VSEQESASNVAEFTVSELSFALKRTVEDAYGYVRVRGEISGYRGPHTSGHAYFALKDEGAKIDAVVWRGVFQRLRFKPEEGMEVVASGKMTTYPGKSAYQIVVDALEPAGAGALMALLEERLRKLAVEGLFDAARKQLLPEYPRVIGVVTSPTGAVIRDILHRLADRFPVHVLVWPVRVQGETSAAEVAAAIRGFDALPVGGPIPRPDVVIVARGGGSLEDLWSFNEEVVARAVAASPIPVISGVGHETDFTICDFVADLRAPTPSAAAEIASRPDEEWVEEVRGLEERLEVGAWDLLDEKRRRVAELAGSYVFREPRRMVEMSAQRIDELGLQLQRGLENTWRHRKQMAVALLQRWMALRPERKVAECGLRLKGAMGRLRALGPEETLRRGYTLVQSPDGKLIRGVTAAKKQGELVVRFSDGKLPVAVKKGCGL